MKNPAQERSYLFGPVPSRRLGLSLGVDIVPFKACSLDCVYCQLGTTTEKTIQRKDYVPVEVVLGRLKKRLAQGLTADYITISGSGEPTLNLRLGDFIDGIKRLTNIPVAILTNSTLLYSPDVRSDCAKADLIVPSLDAGDEQTFRRINRPHPDIGFEKVVAGLCAFRNEYPGPIWLEVFFIEDFNTNIEQISKIADAIERIRPDKVQLNTAVRPSVDPAIAPLPMERLEFIAGKLGVKCEVVADFSTIWRGHHLKAGGQAASDASSDAEHKIQTLLSMLKRRPCSLEDVSLGLGLHRNEVLKYITHLQQQGAVRSEKKAGTIFFRAS